MSGALIIYLAGLPLVLLFAALFITREGARRGDGPLALALAAGRPALAALLLAVIVCDALCALDRCRR